MTEEEIYKEYEFIRQKLYELARLLCEDKTAEAAFLCGNMYAETRIMGEKISLQIKEKLKKEVLDE